MNFSKAGVFALWLAGAACLAMLAFTALGGGRAVFFAEFQPGKGLNAPTASGRYDLSPHLAKVPSHILKLELTVRLSGPGAKAPVLKEGEDELPPIKGEAGRATFILKRPQAKAWRAELSGGSGAPPLHIESIKIRNFAGVNSNPPRLAIVHHAPPDYDGLYLVLIIALVLQGLGFGLWIYNGYQGAWRAAVLTWPPILGLLAALAAQKFGYHLLIRWETLLVVAGLGPCAVLMDWLYKKRRTLQAADFAVRFIICLAAFSLLAGLGFLAEQGRAEGEGLASIIRFGERFAREKQYVPQGVILQKLSYDGQFFVYQAQDPLIRGSAWKNLDSPSYRYQRLLFPLSVNLLTGGDKDLIIPAMTMVNLCCAFATLLIMCLIAQKLGGKWWWGLLCLLDYGFIQPVYWGLAEPMAGFFMVLGIFFLLSKRDLAASLTMTLMVLTKEYYVVMAFAGIFYCLARRDMDRINAYLAPLIVGLVWQFHVGFRFGRLAYEESNGNFAWPLVGVWNHITGQVNPEHAVYTVGVAAVLAAAAWLVLRNPHRREVWFMAAFLALIAVAGPGRTEVGFARTFTPGFLAFLIALYGRMNYWLLLSLIPIAVSLLMLL